MKKTSIKSSVKFNITHDFEIKGKIIDFDTLSEEEKKQIIDCLNDRAMLPEGFRRKTRGNVS